MNKKLHDYIARRIHEKRKKVSFKLEYMSAKIGISIKQLQKYEQGEAKISAARLYDIALVLGVNPDYFFKGFYDFEKNTTVLSRTHIRPDQSGKLNILLVEDSESDGFLVRKAFEKSLVPVELLVMNDSRTVFNFLQNKMTDVAFPRPDLILLNLNLPRTDGISVLRSIKHDRNLSDIPVVILSDSISKQVMIECYKAYASGYICMPLDFNVFAKILDILAHYWAKTAGVPAKPHTH